MQDGLPPVIFASRPSSVLQGRARGGIEILIWLLLAAFVGLGVRGQETNLAIATSQTNTGVSAAAVDPDQHLRLALRLQEQLHAALLAVEQARLEASLEARTNAEVLTGRLIALEQTLTDQRIDQERSTREATRALVIIAAIVIVLGLGALALTAYLQTRGMNRLAEIALGPQAARGIELPGLTPAPGSAQTLLLAGEAKALPNDRLLSTIDRLEQRVHELEGSTRLAIGPGAQNLPRETLPSESNGRAARAGTNSVESVASLLGKGQALLKLGRHAEAIRCFDDAIERAPDDPEVWMKKGIALETQRDSDGALSCYSRVLELSPRHAQASLRKAEILSQQERFAEALECYEQVLRAGSKG